MQTSWIAPVVAPARGGPTDPSHDERLRRGIIDTDVSRRVAVVVAFVFVLLIYGIPSSQAWTEKASGEDSMLLELFRHRPSSDNLRQFEHDLEQASYPKEYAQPRIQLLLSRFGRVGNKLTVIGRGGWLYYQPGISFLTGPSFIDDAVLQSRTKDAADRSQETVHPDPRPAIFAFHDMLAKRGIRLVLFPVPDKAMLEPAHLHGQKVAAGVPVARSVGWAPFLRQVGERGVAVFDPTPATLDQTDEPYFLVQDTHWTPKWMEQVAADLARFLTEVAGLPPPSTRLLLHGVAQQVERVGDLVDMLKLTDDQGLFRPQPVTIHQVQNQDDDTWEPEPTADVLLLGDSFTNVFSSEAMGWGTAAGLAPQLARALGRPVDVIAQNDSGAFATRQALAREVGGDHDRLLGKRVVIWEFASRELAVGNWKPVAWESPASEGAR